RNREPAGQAGGGYHRIGIVDVDQLVDPRYDEDHGDEQAADEDGDHGHETSSTACPSAYAKRTHMGALGSGYRGVKTISATSQSLQSSARSVAVPGPTGRSTSD